jgi:pimeloyl-ACP methyl ester carboxylesterase
LPELREHHGEVIVGGTRLETLSYSAIGDAATIVMLHEGLGSVSMWKDFPKQLARETGCGVLAYSRYGHGKSDRLRTPRSVEFMHNEATVALPALLEQLGIPRPILLGHSDGGSICLIYAATSSASPRALILEAPHLFVEDLTVQSIAKIRDVYKTTDLPQKLARHHDHADETFWGWNDIWLDPAFRDWNIEDRLSSIRCPLLVIQGTEDEYGTLAQVDAMKRRLPHAQSLVLSKCGHSPHRDQPVATLEAMSQFIRKLA